jgi:outer membrane murein-binding lipoprotein Lpp
MTRRYLKLAIVGSLFTLSACAQQSEIRQMHQSVSTLSQEMTQLNQQTVKITQQNALNAKSTRGVYLLPEAKTPARLESQIGTLRMSVGSITPDGDGSRLTCAFRANPTIRCRPLAPPSSGDRSPAPPRAIRKLMFRIS